MVLKLEQVADDKTMCNARQILSKIPVVTPAMNNKMIQDQHSSQSYF